MLIDCPGCAKSYHISRAMLEPHGRDVACPHCATVWFAAPDGSSTPHRDPALADVLGSEPSAPRKGGPREIPGEAVSRKIVTSETTKRTPVLNGQTGLPLAPRRTEVPSVLVCAIAVLVCLMAGLGGRYHIVRLWPQAATGYAAIGLPVNLRGLALHDVHMMLVESGSEPILGIEGEITNLKPAQNKIPMLRLSLRDAQSHEIYAWTTPAPQPRIGGGQTLSFRARLAAPPKAATSLLVSFAPAAHDTLALQR